jgi:hypothetical protein
MDRPFFSLRRRRPSALGLDDLRSWDRADHAVPFQRNTNDPPPAEPQNRPEDVEVGLGRSDAMDGCIVGILYTLAPERPCSISNHRSGPPGHHRFTGVAGVGVQRRQPFAPEKPSARLIVYNIRRLSVPAVEPVRSDWESNELARASLRHGQGAPTPTAGQWPAGVSGFFTLLPEGNCGAQTTIGNCGIIWCGPKIAS